MATQCVVVGAIALPGERIRVRAEVVGRPSRARIALVKRQLKYLLDSRFTPAPESSDEMTVEEVMAAWDCHRVTILRRMQSGEITPIRRNERLYFLRSDVERFKKRKAPAHPRPDADRETRSI